MTAFAASEARQQERAKGEARDSGAMQQGQARVLTSSSMRPTEETWCAEWQMATVGCTTNS